MPQSPRRFSLLSLTVAASAAGLVFVTGCASSSPSGAEVADAQSPEPSPTAPATPPKPDATSASSDLTRIFEENATILPSLARGEVGASDAPVANRPAEAVPVAATNERPLQIDWPSLDRAARGEPDGTVDGLIPPIELDYQPPPPLQTTSQPRAATPSATPENPAQRRDRLVSELAALLRVQATDAQAPLAAYAAIAALESLGARTLGAMASPESPSDLSPRETELLAAWREMHRAVGDPLAPTPGLAGGLADAVEIAAAKVSGWAPVRINCAELCSRVEGFGVYNPLPGARFLAGRQHRAIVYAEIDRFSAREKDGASSRGGSQLDRSNVPGYVVELSEELSLFHDADGTLAWRRPEEIVTDFSRNRRRDFYMVQMIELPETLTVGAYRLKVTIRDRNAGSMAEAIIPIEVVADPELVVAPD